MKTQYLILVVASLLMLVGQVGLLTAKPLTLKESVTVQNPPLTLGKLVNQSVPEKLNTIELGKLPSPGHSRFISRSYVLMQAARKKLNLPSLSREVSQTRVSRPSQTISQTDLSSRIKSLLEDHLALGAGGSISLTSMPESMTILPGSFSLSIKSKNPYTQSRGNSWFTIQVRQNETIIKTFRVNANVQKFSKVPVLKNPVSRGSTLKKSDVSWKERDIGTRGDQILTKNSNFNGMKATRSLRAETILTADHVRKPILIDRRKKIRILYKSKGLTVTVPGESLEEGAEGDRIEVKNLSSDETVVAEVLNESTVRVGTTDSGSQQS